MLYIRAPELHLETISLYSLTNISPFPAPHRPIPYPPQALVTAVLVSVFMRLAFLDSTYRWYYTRICLYLSYFTKHYALKVYP